MKALSIIQPWAWAILCAGKDIENRDWKTSFRGTIAVHASKGLTKSSYAWDQLYIEQVSGLRPPTYPALKYRGCILGTVEIIDCVGEHRSPWFVGKYGFVLRNPRILTEPIYCKGRLGFWEVPKDLLDGREWNQFPEVTR